MPAPLFGSLASSIYNVLESDFYSRSRHQGASLSLMASPGKAAAVEQASEACRESDAALARAFDFLGKRWNGVILGVLGRGPTGFRELSRAIGGISDSVLSDRLAELARAGLIARTVDEGPPVSVTYALTDCGKALTPALEQLARWAQENLLAGELRSE
jgi:DNA-binding HxlR family transcriptional regulator